VVADAATLNRSVRIVTVTQTREALEVAFIARSFKIIEIVMLYSDCD
jgi:hypothetical protein